jgi:hypothetical protein
MFSKDQTAGRVVCLADYGRVKKGAIVPKSNELYADVEAWLSDGNTLSDFTGYPDIPMTAEQRQDWRDNASVSAYQARAALKRAGYMVRVRGLMSQLDQDDETRMAWETAREFRRMSPTMLAMAAKIGIDDQELDSLFEAGSQIEA